MNFVKAGMVALLMVLGPLGSGALGAESSDFAFGLPLSWEKEAPVYELVLPDTVYETVTRPDLGDVRVFNAQGEVVPHTILTPRDQPGPAMDPVSLPFFPLSEKEKQDDSSLALSVVQNEAGMILSLKSGLEHHDRSPVKAYLLDGSILKSPPIRLELNWTAAEDSLVTHVRLEASNDLSHWSLKARATLADLKFAGHRIVKQTIDFPPLMARYFYLTWPAGKDGAVLNRVRAFFPRPGQEPSRKKKMVQATGSAESSDEYFFDIKGYFPVDRVMVIPPQPNTLAQVTLSSRIRERDQWRPVFQGPVFNLTVDGTSIMNDPVQMTPDRSRYYRLKVDPGGGGLGHGLPSLEVSWQPRKVFFVARGQAPFVLAFGNALALPEDAPLDPVLEHLDRKTGRRMVREALVGEKFALGGPERLVRPKPPIPWSQVALWGVLIAGVLALGLTAWRLYRQMNPRT